MSKNIQDSITTLVKTVKENPEKRTDIFVAETHLSEGLFVKASIGQHQFNFDEPAVLGGTDLAPNPVEYLLATLGTCQTIVYRILALGHKIPFEDLQVKLKGHLDLRGFLAIDSNVRPGFNKVEAETIVKTEEDEEKVNRLYDTVKRYCPVLDILSNEIEVAGKLIVTPSDYKEHEDVSKIKDGLQQLIGQIKANPEIAASVFETDVFLKEKLTNEVKARSFSFKVDKETTYGGLESAPNPLEYLLAALGACQSIVYKALAALKGIRIDEVNIVVTGYLDVRGLLAIDDNVRPGYQKIEYVTELVSNESPEVLERLSKQVEALCPVLDNIVNPVEVVAKHVIVPTEAAVV
ncbi:MAG: OsmC family protein [Chitinophagales bacterium]|nr:OsmC family protein [Chitinophagales bacterium]